jgi:hypothetical protein
VPATRQELGLPGLIAGSERVRGVRVLFARVICSFRVLLNRLDDPVPSLPDGHEDASG